MASPTVAELQVELQVTSCAVCRTCLLVCARCVYVSETTFDAKDKTVVVQDVIADPTLPRTKDVNCPQCHHNEAVFISESTEKGMTLYFNCVACKHRWKDYI